MRIATITLIGISGYSGSRETEGFPRGDKESHEAYDKRIWRERIWHDAAGNCYIHPSALKFALVSTCQFLSFQIPGKGKATFTKHFNAGVLVMDPIMLGITQDKLRSELVYCHVTGKRGEGKRVWRTYPMVDQWETEAKLYITDDVLTEKVVERVLEQAGQFNGLGRFRPQNGGFLGRFKIGKIVWSEQ